MTEFDCITLEGTEKMGAMVFGIIEISQDQSHIKDVFVRNEKV